jgi:hypothetical protein
MSSIPRLQGKIKKKEEGAVRWKEMIGDDTYERAV